MHSRISTRLVLRVSTLAVALLAASPAWAQSCPTGTTIPNFRFVSGTNTVPRQVTYAWSAPAGAPVGTTYQILRALSPDYCSGFPALAVVAETTGLSYTATLETPDRVYEYWVRVKGCDVAATGVWLDDSFQTPPSAPALSLTGTTANQVTLSVTQPDGRTAAQVIERAGANGAFQQIGTRFFNDICPAGSAQQIVDAGLAPGTYTYRVWSLNQGTFQQVFSNSVTVTVGGSTEAAPVVVFYSASPAAVIAGEESTLSWFTTGATSASIDQGIGVVPVNGTITVHPTSTTTYTLTVTGPGGTRTSRVQVTVGPNPQPGTAAATLVTVASAAGLNGSFFRTSVQLTNPTDTVAFGRLVFHSREREGSEGDAFTRYTLQPRQTLEITDVLALIGTSGAGSLDVVPEGGGVPVVRARVYNDAGAAGTTGVVEDALPPSEALHTGETAVLLAPPDFQRFRFSVGLFTLPSGATLTFTVRNAQGQVIRTFTENFTGTFYIQRLSSQIFEGLSLTGNESVTVQVTSGAAFVYATVGDNITNDPSIQIAKRLP